MSPDISSISSSERPSAEELEVGLNVVLSSIARSSASISARSAESLLRSTSSIHSNAASTSSPKISPCSRSACSSAPTSRPHISLPSVYSVGYLPARNAATSLRFKASDIFFRSKPSLESIIKSITSPLVRFVNKPPRSSSKSTVTIRLPTNVIAPVLLSCLY